MSFSIFQTGSGYNCYWWIYKLDLNHLDVELFKRMAPYMGGTGNENEASNTGVTLRTRIHLTTVSEPCLNIKAVFPRYRILVFRIRRWRDHLIFNMGIPVLVRRHLYIETAPWFLGKKIMKVIFMSYICKVVQMGTIASQITTLAIIYSIAYSSADPRKHQSSASLAFVQGIHRGPVNSPHKWPVTRKMIPFDDVIMLYWE